MVARSHWFYTLCVAAIVFLFFSTATAQDAAITQAQYLELLRQTEQDLSTALTDTAARERILQANTERWQTITAVQTDEATISVDTGWLELSADAGGEAIQTALRRIDALQAYAGADGISLDGLEGFSHQQQAPPPPSRPPEIRGSISPALQSFAQVALFAMGIALVIAILFAAARGLRFKTAVAPKSTDEDDDPQTSDDARQRAQSSEKVQDYRAAVRYLYLSSLLMLDESGLIRYDPTLTNQEHLVQIDDRPNLKGILTPIINFFDRTWYGFAPISDDDYEQFRRQVNQLQQLATERQS